VFTCCATDSYILYFLNIYIFTCILYNDCSFLNAHALPSTELFAIGQGLPGPTSTQLVISTALARAGPLGGLLAFFLWNLPGLIVLTVSGVLIANFIDPNDPPFWLVGLPPAAIALVFKAMYGFGSKLDTLGVILALISACVAILISGDEVIKPTSSQYVFPSMLVAGGLISWLDSKRAKPLGEF